MLMHGAAHTSPSSSPFFRWGFPDEDATRIFARLRFRHFLAGFLGRLFPGKHAGKPKTGSKKIQEIKQTVLKNPEFRTCKSKD
jgi:hypothetical protein